MMYLIRIRARLDGLVVAVCREAGRAGRMLYGTVTVTPRPRPSWDEFIATSTTGKRQHNFE